MLKIIHLTDIHLPANETDVLYGINIHSVVYKIAEKISQIKDIDCIIITGDIANKGDYNAYLTLDKAFKDIYVPIFWLQGNHDFSEVMLQVSTKVKIKSEKCFVIKNTKFILLQEPTLSCLRFSDFGIFIKTRRCQADKRLFKLLTIS